MFRAICGYKRDRAQGKGEGRNYNSKSQYKDLYIFIECRFGLHFMVKDKDESKSVKKKNNLVSKENI